MQLRVSHVRQCGPFSFIVKYLAEVEMMPGESGLSIFVMSTVPDDADPELVAEAAESIRRGAESILQPRGVGAKLSLQGLCIHEVDFSPQKFEHIIAEEISRALGTTA